ncbi:MAG: class I poly(R)-hydroxyalkanoic acid synthase [Betaproteobacteria bacterium RIFCSPLOWO2_02_FULL_65_24]|nr:MAG: class I poly(R)-hydroxyalkanoic acid synthase [Betaproteobacteria bacterium RIFCSPLOWO2_02_FULL_65_24]
MCGAIIRHFYCNALKPHRVIHPDWSATTPLAKAQQAALENVLKVLAAQAGPDVVRQWPAAGIASSRVGQLQADFYRRHMAAWQSIVGQGRPAAQPGHRHVTDRRFSGAEWNSSPYYDYLRQAYVVNSEFLAELVEALELEPRAKQRLRFVARQLIDAMSPANYAATNPEALTLALQTKGESLSRGIRNLLEDVRKGRISTTDESAFELGRNIAVTQGEVVFENELMQLIQYAPVTRSVHARPLVMVPPCINKYYVLDLQPENSLVRHALEQGQQVFMVSWRNITPETARFRWDDYLELGVLKAIDVASDIAAREEVNVLGFCVGGTMVGAALAVLAARGDERVCSVTLLASMLDFADAGEIAVFIDETSIAAREAAIGAGGIMPGRDLATAFSALRANDLVWPYVVNNYLKGRTPPAFDLLHWNADSTNLPGPMYCYYVRRMYMENALKEPGRLSMLGTPVDLSRVRIPAYVLATREDHIVPWKSAYRSVQLLGGEKRFVLGASGHIAGVINPAWKNRRSFWVNSRTADEPDRWLAEANEQAGSWWNDWAGWLARHGGGKARARKRLGNVRYRPLEPAPGRYVKMRAS